MEGMQFLTINPDPDKSDPEDQEPKVVSLEMQPLDVNNLAVHWPEWCDQFKVYFAANYDYQLDDKEKLSIFLKCLGQGGSDMASCLYPKLNDLAVDSDAFDEVWWRMSELWNVAKDVDQDRRRTRDTVEERRRFMVNSVDEIDKDKWLLLIPHLSLCELEYMAETVPRLERIVRNHSRLFGVKIEKCCLEKYSVDTDKEVFQKYESISSVTLKDLPESDARAVLQVFKDIQQFTMQNMLIIDDISGFPNKLSELNLDDCQIEVELMDEWLSSIKSSLKRLCLDNLKHNFTLQHRNFCGDTTSHLLGYSSEKLCSLSLKGDFLSFYGGGRQMQFLNISTTKEFRYYDIDGSSVTHLHVFPLSILSSFDCFNFKFLSMKDWIPSTYIRYFTSLEYLWIMSPVHPKYKEEIEKLKIKTVIVNYEHVAEPPEEPNLIFDMLNEYCLLEITDYLSIPDWMKFGQLHWKVEMALCSYKYTRVELTKRDIRQSGISTDSDYFNYVAQFVTKFKIYLQDSIEYNNWCFKFSSLKSLNLKSFRGFVHGIDTLPDGLEKLILFGFFAFDGDILQPYFRRLNSSLTVLGLKKSPGLDSLSELTNLREIDVSNYIPIGDVLILLKQNEKLQRIGILFINYLGDHSWFISDEIFKQIGQMQQLQDLSVVDEGNGKLIAEGSGIIIADVFERIGPQLKKLSLSARFLGPEMISVAKRGFLSNIKEFHLKNPMEEEDLKNIHALICLMTSLEKLCCADVFALNTYSDSDEDSDSTNYNIFEDSDFLLLIKSLPFLVKIELPPTVYKVRFMTKLLKYLRATNRQLQINATTFP